MLSRKPGFSSCSESSSEASWLGASVVHVELEREAGGRGVQAKVTRHGVEADAPRTGAVTVGADGGELGAALGAAADRAAVLQSRARKGGEDATARHAHLLDPRRGVGGRRVVLCRLHDVRASVAAKDGRGGARDLWRALPQSDQREDYCED